MGEEGEEGVAKRVKASWMERSVEAEMLFWRARAEGLGWGSEGGGGRLVGRERVGGCDGVVSWEDEEVLHEGMGIYHWCEVV